LTLHIESLIQKIATNKKLKPNSALNKKRGYLLGQPLFLLLTVRFYNMITR